MVSRSIRSAGAGCDVAADADFSGAGADSAATAEAKAGIPAAAAADFKNDLRAGPVLFGMTNFSRHSIQRGRSKTRTIHARKGVERVGFILRGTSVPQGPMWAGLKSHAD